MNMKDILKKRKVVLPVLAVILIATAGVGYALYTSEFQNSGNTTTKTYMVLTPEGATAYSGAFCGEIYYDVVNDAGTITYSLSDSQLTEIVIDATPVNAVLLGELIVDVAQTGGPNDFTLKMEQVSGIMATGSYYMGVATTSDSGSTFGSYQCVPLGTDSATIGSANTIIKIGLFVGESFQPDANATVVQPLDHVTFKITATV